MKNKGFTLIELLAVIVILAIIALISTFIITNLIDKSKAGAYENQRNMLSRATELYYFKYRDDLIWDGDTTYVEISTLKEKNLLRDEVVNPLNGTDIPDDAKVLIYKEGKNIKYSLQLYDDASFKWYQDEMVEAVRTMNVTLPTVIGDRAIIDLNELMNLGKVAEMRIPTDIANRCVGSIEIEKIAADEYEYNAYVDCLTDASTFASNYVSYGGKYLDEFSEVKQTNDGGYIAVGNSNSETITKYGIGNNGKYDAIIVKFDSEGNVVWSRNFGGSNNEYFYSVAEIPNGYVAVGTTSSTDGDLTGEYKGGTLDAIMVKYDDEGNLVDKLSYGTTSTTYRELFTRVIYDGNNIVVVGTINLINKDGDFTGVVSPLTSDVAVIIKMDTNFNTIWRQLFGGTRFDYFSSVKHTTDNGYIVSGYSTSNDYDMTGIGYEGLSKREAIVVKYDTSGNVVYKTSFRGSNDEYFYDITEVNDGYVAIGNSNSADLNMSGISKANNLMADAIIVKFDKNLENILWQKSFGGSNPETFNGVTQINGNQIIVVGYSKSEDIDMNGITISHGGYSNAVIAKYNNDGNLVDKKVFGGTNSEVFNSILSIDNNRYIVAGLTYSTNRYLQNFNKGHGDALLVSYDDHLNLSKIFKEPVVIIDRLKVIQPTYGATLSLNYSNIYTSNNPEIDLGNWCSDNSNYGFQYNYKYGACLVPFNNDDIKLLTNIETVNGYRMVHLGEYEYSIDIEPDNEYNWHRVYMNFVNSSSLEVSNFKLKFADNYVGNISEAVAAGYIEPLVVLANTISRLPIEDPRYFFPTPLNLIDNSGTTGLGLSPSLIMYFKPKLSQLSAIIFTCNKDTTTDGVLIQEIRNFDMSISPTE